MLPTKTHTLPGSLLMLTRYIGGVLYSGKVRSRIVYNTTGVFYGACYIALCVCSYCVCANTCK